MATQRLCSIPECGNKHYCRGFCAGHYSRWHRFGDPHAEVRPIAPRGEAARFFKETVLTYTGAECLIWPYGKSRGYGIMHVNGETKLVHRLACEHRNGPPPTPKYEASHICGKGNHGCVSPSHLVWKTHAGNMADTLQHGTHSRGERHGMSKLTAEDVQLIRYLQGKATQRKLAQLFGVSRANIGRIQTGQGWSWLAE